MFILHGNLRRCGSHRTATGIDFPCVHNIIAFRDVDFRAEIDNRADVRRNDAQDLANRRARTLRPSDEPMLFTQFRYCEMAKIPFPTAQAGERTIRTKNF